MAATSQGARLTEAHRLEQQRVRDDFLTEFIALWVLLDATRLDETTPGWLRAVMALIRDHRRISAELAAGYYYDFRAAEAPSSRPTPRPTLDPPPSTPPPSPTPRRQPRTPEPARPRNTTDLDVTPRPRRTRIDFDDSAFAPAPERRTRIELPDIDWSPADRAARVSLLVTGPVGQKSKASRGKPLGVARDESFVDTSGAATRHVLTGGRQSLLTLLGDDPQALGWARVTDGDPCAFCALLASRGPVYGSEASAGFRAHDNCACTAEPVYSRQAPWPGRAAEFRRIYRASTSGTSGRNSINAFRRAYEQQQRDARRANVA